jgi:ribosome biogenesis GTPase A
MNMHILLGAISLLHVATSLVILPALEQRRLIALSGTRRNTAKRSGGGPIGGNEDIWEDTDTSSTSSTSGSSVGVESTAVIQWYPGHIAKAEKKLVDVLKTVDVVVELRDARIPAATAHPSVPEWVGANKPRIVVFARVDQAPRAATDEWRYALSRDKSLGGAPMFWIDSQRGTGCRDVRRAILAAGAHVNKKRELRGLLPRPVRASIIGFPNVGKSALINQLVGKRRAASADKPGVTKSLNWIKIGAGEKQELLLLDSPGIIPARHVDQTAALRLAVCNEIGEAAYDGERVAAALVEILVATHALRPSFVDLPLLHKRYGIDPAATNGETYLNLFAAKHFRGDLFFAARRLLDDARKGYLGKISLDVPAGTGPEGAGAVPTATVVEGSPAGADGNVPTKAAIYLAKDDPAAQAPLPADRRSAIRAAKAAAIAEQAAASEGFDPIDLPSDSQLGASSFEGW